MLLSIVIKMSSENQVTVKIPDLDLWKVLTLLTFLLVAVNFIFTLQLKSSLSSITQHVLELNGGTGNGGSGTGATSPPTRVKVDFKDEPYLGDTNSKVVIIEFTDFQCPFCKLAFDTTYPSIRSDYVDTGKVLYVVRDFPLPKHTEADEAAEAANCAGEQSLDNFWKMHDLLFSKQDEWAGNSNPKNVFKVYAKGLGLNTVAFNSCLDSNKYQSEIQADIQDGIKYGVDGTPTFYIGTPAKGFVEVIGAQPLSIFKQIIDQELAA